MGEKGGSGSGWACVRGTPGPAVCPSPPLLSDNDWEFVLDCAQQRAVATGQLCGLLLVCTAPPHHHFPSPRPAPSRPIPQDQISAAVGWAGAPSTTAVACFMFALLLVNSLIYCFLLHVVYRLILQAMGFDLGPLPGIVRKYLYAGMPEPTSVPPAAGQAPPLQQP